MANYSFIDLGGRRHLFFNDDNCLYHKRGRAQQNYYVCVDKECSASGKVEHDNFRRINFLQHQHENHFHKHEAEKKYAELKELVRSSNRPTRDLYNETIANV